MSGLALPAFLAQLTRCAADDNGRYSICGVRLTDPGGGQYKATVTDGRRLIHVQGYCPESNTEPPGELGCPPDVPVTVPSEAWNVIFKFAPKLIGHDRYRYDGKTAPVRVARLADGKLLLSSRDRTLTTEQLDCRFPDWQRVMPKGKPQAVVHVQPKLLAEMLTTIAAMLPDTDQRVTLCFFNRNEPLGIVAKHSSGCIDALVMPLTEPDPPEEEEKREPQASIQETVEEYFTECSDWPFEIDDVDYFTDEVMAEYDLPWDRDVVRAAIEGFKQQQEQTTTETPTVEEQPNG